MRNLTIKGEASKRTAGDNTSVTNTEGEDFMAIPESSHLSNDLYCLEIRQIL